MTKKHNNASAEKSAFFTQEQVMDATEEELRAAVEKFTGCSFPEMKFHALRTRCVMAILSVKYEAPQFGEDPTEFTSRKDDIMASAIKDDLKKKLTAKGESRAKTGAAAAAKKAAVAPKAKKEPNEGGKAGRAPAFTKVKANKEGESRLQEGSQRTAVYHAIAEHGAKGVEVAALDEQLGLNTRPYIMKLKEKGWVEVS